MIYNYREIYRPGREIETFLRWLQIEYSYKQYMFYWSLIWWWAYAGSERCPKHFRQTPADINFNLHHSLQVFDGDYYWNSKNTHIERYGYMKTCKTSLNPNDVNWNVCLGCIPLSPDLTLSNFFIHFKRKTRALKS